MTDEAPQVSSTADGMLAGARIVVVDDDIDVADSMRLALTTEGASVRVVSDGNAAVRTILDDKPDVVLLDMMLPKRSGFLVLEQIKGYEDSPIVIMVTANEGKRHQNYAESVGVDRYLQKPVPLTLLIETVKELLDARG